MFMFLHIWRDKNKSKNTIPFLLHNRWFCQGFLNLNESRIFYYHFKLGLSMSNYHDRAGRTDIISGGVKMIPITTPIGKFKIWTKRGGNNPRSKGWLLHGGPAATHEQYTSCDSYFPGAEIEYYYYDQLGSHYSDQPKGKLLSGRSCHLDDCGQLWPMSCLHGIRSSRKMHGTI